MGTILLIDDDPTIRQVTSSILELSGFSVLEADNGRDGVTLAKSSKVDLIICDVEMPDLDGYGVQKIINSEPLLIHTPFIFLSGKNDISDIRKGMDLGADDYLTKPLSKTDLLNAVDSRLTKARKLKMVNTQKISSGSIGFTIEDLIDSGKSLTIEKNQVVYFQGDLPHSLYFLKSGRIKIAKSSSDGKEFVSDILKPGSFFGEQALIDQTAYNEDAFALEESVIIYLPQEKVLNLLHQDPFASFDFLKLINEKLKENENRLVSMAYDSVKKRTADVLLGLEGKFKNHDLEQRVEIKISRDDLAALVGTASESVIRVLRDLKNEDILEVKGRTIQIKNIEKLRNQYY